MMCHDGKQFSLKLTKIHVVGGAKLNWVPTDHMNYKKKLVKV